MKTQNSELQSWIREHKVCWELLPHWMSDRGNRVQVGFELNLFAQHGPSVLASPGCPKCQDLFRVLQQIAQAALPTENRPTRYEICPFDSSFHLRPETRMKNEVQLTLLLIHRENVLDPVDDCEHKCATEIEERLKELGAQRRVWSDLGSAPA